MIVSDKVNISHDVNDWKWHHTGNVHYSKLYTHNGHIIDDPQTKCIKPRW